ncbi:MAG: cytochrome c [Rhodobacteraceae bacterium]|nr:cytochrome c [Paracoccaceae bacterium]
MKIIRPIVAIALVTACTPMPQTGAELFSTNCVACHGVDARGGAMPGAPDLTTLASRHGGAFPRTYIMSTIDGFSRDVTHGPMPIFGDVLEGEMEVWTDENGVETPTPAVLLRLAEYLEGLQG